MTSLAEWLTYTNVQPHKTPIPGGLAGWEDALSHVASQCGIIGDLPDHKGEQGGHLLRNDT